MLNTLRMRIITLCIASITIVIFAITASINIANTIRQTQREDNMLTLISDYNGVIPQMSNDNDNIKDRFGITVTGETAFQTRYFVVYADNDGNIIEAKTNNIATVTQEEIQNLIHELSGKPDNARGTILHFRYLVKETGNCKMLSFLDRTQDLESGMQLLGVSIFIGFAGLSLICILLIFISKVLLVPFIKNQEKQKQFITDAGHELKTPLAIIRTNAEVLEMCNGKNEWIDSIKNQTERLDGLVKGLLELAKGNEINADEEHVKFSLSSTVNSIAESFKTMAEQKGHTMHFDITPNIDYTGNAQSISTLVSILIDNSIKYAADNGEIFVSLSPTGKSSTKNARLVVSNDIPEDFNEDPNRFFERFYRSESSRSRQTGGYGIGLSVAKNIVDNHKGKITASQANNRISFTVIL